MAMETQWENAKFYANFLVGKNLIWSVILRIEPESGFNKMAKNNWSEFVRIIITPLQTIDSNHGHVIIKIYLAQTYLQYFLV